MPSNLGQGVNKVHRINIGVYVLSLLHDVKRGVRGTIHQQHKEEGDQSRNMGGIDMVVVVAPV